MSLAGHERRQGPTMPNPLTSSSAARPHIVLAAMFALILCVVTVNRATPEVFATISEWNVKLIGHDPLFNRGMNAALAVYDHFVYVGNRTDSSAICVGATGLPSGDTCPHPHPGILIVDIKDPAHPKEVGEIGKPYAANVGITTRELRVWPDEKLLIVMDFRCSHTIHPCQSGTDAQFPFDLAFFDLSDPLQPRFISRFVPTSKAGKQVKPHEMFLWVDPSNRNRALL